MRGLGRLTRELQLGGLLLEEEAARAPVPSERAHLLLERFHRLLQQRVLPLVQLLTAPLQLLHLRVRLLQQHLHTLSHIDLRIKKIRNTST